MKVSINYADIKDFDYLANNDHHITKEMLAVKIQAQEILILRVDTKPIGWLRFGYFWDNIPFMNLLFFEEGYRVKGLGSELVAFWEQEMQAAGYQIVMTSTLANEQAQFFYRKLGYKDSGCLLLENEALEILFTKNLSGVELVF